MHKSGLSILEEEEKGEEEGEGKKERRVVCWFKSFVIKVSAMQLLGGKIHDCLPA